MTWEGLKQENSLVYVSPRNWKDALIRKQYGEPDFFLCESAWCGVEKSSWRGQVYKDGRVSYENRGALLDILQHCKLIGIATVFWAKEDPAYFMDAVYDFTSTALKFDYILTTAEECIDKYKELGHKNVHLWPFGFSPEIYHPPQDSAASRENIAVFAGGWHAEHTHRCEDLLVIFDEVKSTGLGLRIYDRYRTSGHSTKPFPDAYQQYVHDGVPYESLGDIYRSVQYVINVNTVRDSATMFARRVYEAMACGCIVISNESIGMRKQFGNTVWYAGNKDQFDFTTIEDIRKKNIEIAFASHTWAKRMQQLQDILTNFMNGSGI